MGLGVAGLALTAVSTAVSAFGQIQQGKAAEKQAQFQAQVARNNAIIAERKAQDAIDRGKVAEAERRQETAQLLARQRASAAAGGVLVDTGSILDIISDTAGLGELDALTIRANAQREATGFRDQAAQFQNDASLTEAAGQNRRRASLINAGGTLLEGGAKVASRWQSLS